MKRRHLTTTLSILVLLPAFAAASDAGHPDRPEQLAPLEFLVGSWDLTTWFLQPDGSRRETSATLEARWALGGLGLVVEETHPYPDGTGGIFASQVIYSVRPDTGQIVGASNNTLGNRKQLDVEVDGDTIRQRQEGELFEGRSGFNRHVIRAIGDDRFELRLDACPDDGGPCREGTYGYVAVRRE